MLVPDPELPEGERAKILDFGIAKLTGDGSAESLKVKTKTGAMLGTPTYMSPEQCRGVGLIDGRTDVYALGVILFELLAGKTPFSSEGLGELIGMHMFQPPPDLLPLAPGTPPALLQLVARMLAKSPAERPSMAEAADALKSIGRGASQSGLAMPVLSATPAAPDAAAPTLNTTFGSSAGQSAGVAPTPRRPTLGFVAAAGAVAVVLLTGSGVLWSQLRESRVHPSSLTQLSRSPNTTAPTSSPTAAPTAAPTANADAVPAAAPRRAVEDSPPAAVSPVPHTSPASSSRGASVNTAARCQSLYKRGRYADAVTACTAVLGSDPAHPDVQRTLRAAQEAAAAPKTRPSAATPASPPATPPRHYEKVKALD